LTRQYRYRTGDQALVRQINLSVIMHELRQNAPISRAALAERTGLNKTTVSSLVRELIERQFVREVGLEQPGSGRRAGRLAMLLTLNPNAGYIVSCEIGVDFILVVCTNFAPEIIWRHNENIDPEMGQNTIINRVLALLHQAVDFGKGACCSNLLGISVGVPGLVDQTSGTLLFAPNLNWENVPLRAILHESLEAPVFVDNEANLAALGEHYFGAAQGCEEMLYISAGVGLGGGIVHGGQIFSGVTGFSAEFGHITSDPDGEQCNCGNKGCWETQVSQRALFRHVQLSSQKRTSTLFRMTNGDFSRLTVPMVVQAAQSGDVLALESLEKIGHHLGIGIASLVNALNPELVVFGGILSLAGEYLLPCLQEELLERALRWNRESTEVVLAQHGFDSCVMGGVATVYQAILGEPG
jgi:glucokinase-like ROK family protein